ncbi:hypothetical protein, partial [Mesorhizobium sp. M0085]|uniref:hypothetical protein n=1 Tax=Mesorhizobium sp. M0085 TaxID=2956872 RepID=UPI0033351441
RRAYGAPEFRGDAFRADEEERFAKFKPAPRPIWCPMKLFRETAIQTGGARRKLGKPTLWKHAGYLPSCCPLFLPFCWLVSSLAEPMPLPPATLCPAIGEGCGQFEGLNHSC